MYKLRRYFLAGIGIILPIFVTAYLIVFILKFADNLVGRFINPYLKSIWGFYIPGLGIILFILLSLCAGFLITHILGKGIFPQLEKTFVNLPLVRHIYPSAKQIVEYLFSRDKPAFKKVAVIEYPRKGIFSLGFVTNDGIKELEEKTGDSMVNILVPSTPSPFTGYFVMMPKKDVIFLDITVEEGIKMVISGGVLNPEDVRGLTKTKGVV